MYFERIVVFEAYHTFVEGQTHRYFVEAPDILTHVHTQAQEVTCYNGTDGH